MKNFDTYAASKKAITAGFNRKQTNFIMCLLSQFEHYLNDNFITKKDFKHETKDIRREIQNLESSLKKDMNILEKNLVIKLGAISLAVSVLTISAISLLIKMF